MNLWRAFFAFAALFNIAAGGAMVAGPVRIGAQLGAEGAGAPYAVMMVGLLIAVFGLGYAIVARAPAQNRGIVWIGLASKLGAVALGWTQYDAGALPTSMLPLIGSDLMFAVLFALFLWRGPK